MTRPSSKRPQPPRTASPEIRRKQLIEATIRCIAQHGIKGTTTALIAGQAGLSTGLVNFHFKSKQNLFEETLLYLAHEHHDAWMKDYHNAGLSAWDKLCAIVNAHFRPEICNPQKLAVWYAFFGEGSRRKVYRDLVHEIDDERYELSAELCRALCEEGGCNCAQAADVAEMLEAMYDGLWLNMLIYPNKMTRDAARNLIMAYLNSVFPGNDTTS